MSCDWDYPSPEFYNSRIQKARKSHKCGECGCEILKGEEYEYVAAVWEGSFGWMKTCSDCLLLRKAFDEMPCFCWTHGGLLEEVKLQLQEAEFEPGEKFFYLRMIANHRKNKK